MFESVRARLTMWYTGVLALVLIVFALISYLFLARTLTQRTDDALEEMGRAFAETVQGEQRELDARDANAVARDDKAQAVTASADAAVLEAASEHRFKDYQFIVYDDARRIVAASSGFSVEQQQPNAPLWTRAPISSGLARLLDARAAKAGATASATLGTGDDKFRALARTLQTNNRSYTLVVLRPLDEQEDLLEGAGGALLIAVPLALGLASVGGYFLARKSLAPVVAMSEMAARIGASNLHERLPVANERDELGRLARAFNKLLSRLHESFEQQRRFMADASHELRTPVAIVRGEAEVSLSRDERGAADYRESLAIVHDEGRRLTRIVEDLFTLARADAGQHPLQLKDFYLDETVAECARAVRTLAAARGLSIETNAPHEMLFRGDEELIRRMLLNLLDNAIKYTPAGGRIAVKCEARGSEYVLSVSDTGIGIPLEAQPLIFERFYRADKARSREENAGGTIATAGSGAGLGLSIARLVAEAHNGRLELLNSNEGGSVFVATLPAPEPDNE